jgi:glucan 1,3-beta-glucosidase
MAADTANGGISQLENHYKTFIVRHNFNHSDCGNPHGKKQTEKDFAEIAGAGLNYVRIPLAYWAIETRENEPFLAKTSWTCALRWLHMSRWFLSHLRYFLKAIQWARKYGIRINLDFHAVPGSQNGWNHSGRLGSINFLNGPMGYANAQRTLDYIRILAEFLSQPQYSSVVTIMGIINEPMASPPTIGADQISALWVTCLIKWLSVLTVFRIQLLSSV